MIKFITYRCLEKGPVERVIEKRWNRTWKTTFSLLHRDVIITTTRYNKCSLFKLQQPPLGISIIGKASEVSTIADDMTTESEGIKRRISA